MKNLIGCALSIVIAATSSISMADDTGYVDSNTYHPVVEPQRDKFHGGFDLSIGVPQGAGVGFAFEPFTHWVRGEIGVQNNLFSWGGMASATFTPIKFPIMPVLQLEGGFFPQGTAPSFIVSAADGKILPTVGYQYLSFGPGVEFGNREHALFFIHVDASYIHASSGNFQAVVNDNVKSIGNLTVANPNISGWVLPTARLGFVVMF